MRSICLAGALAGSICTGAAGMMPSQSAASPSLGEKSCPQLATERDALKALGVERDMAKGPAWARTNLSGSELQLIKLFIEIGERLRFKCADQVQLARPAGSPVLPAGLMTPSVKPDFQPPLPVKRVIQLRPAPKPLIKSPGGKPLPVKAATKPASR